MNIRYKTPQEIHTDISHVSKDITLWTSRQDLLGVLSEKNYASYLRNTKQLAKERSIYKENWILVLRILDDYLPIKHTKTWNTAELYKTIIQFGDYQESLYLHDMIQDPGIKILKIIIQWNTKTQELNLPLPDKRNILNYLIKGQPPIPFDCKAFVHKIKWVNIPEWSFTNTWSFEEKQEQDLKPGDSVFLFDYFWENHREYHNVRHFAYYLWHGLYLSKFWFKGALWVATLEEMHTFYGTKEFITMSPKEDKEIHHRAAHIRKKELQIQ